MGHDMGWKGFLSDDARYADIINGIALDGNQNVKKEDLQEADTQTGFLPRLKFIQEFSPGKQHNRIKIRDTIRRIAFGVNFAIVGIESQEFPDYSLPLRNMAYDVGNYEKQAAKIRKEVRKTKTGLSRGEYLYGFRRESKLHPVVTFILYSGSEAWNGPKSLHQMLDFTDIPDNIRQMIPNYRINLIEIRKFADTSVFQTDVRQVFDFIRCSEDKDALKALIAKDDYYKSMEEDAFDVVVQYANATELVAAKDYYEKDGKIDMCKAITEWLADERNAGIAEGKLAGIAEGKLTGFEEKTKTIVKNMINRGMTDADICALAECDQELIDTIRNELAEK